jgi:hypothetical protein
MGTQYPSPYTVQSAINFYSIGVYLYLGEEVTNADMMDHSSRYALLNSFPGYIVQTLFITICYTLYCHYHTAATT